MTAQELTDKEVEEVRNADATERQKIWADWVVRFRPREASRRWLAVFGAIDASETG